MSRAVMQQALEFCEFLWRDVMMNDYSFERLEQNITSLRAALAEPEQPVAWMQEMPVSGNEERSVRMTTVKMVADEWDNPIPLYTAPTPRKPQTTHWEGCEAVHPECRKPEQEPCAMRYDFDGYGYKYIDSGSGSNWQTRIKDAEPLYTAPTPHKPVELTDEQIVQVLGSVRESITGSVFLAFAHAVIAEYKRKNGIGEQHE